VLQHKLGAKNAGTFDVGCACASFPTGLAAGAGIIAANPGIKTVLVVGVYLMHKLTTAADPMVFFYGDGAGAAVLEPAASPGFITATFRADGSYHDYWGIYSGGTFEPASEDSVKAGRTACTIKNRYPPELNEETWPLIVQRLAKDGGFDLRDVDCFIFTQVRKPTIARVMERLGVPAERAHTIMEQYGYTGSACVGMALDHAIELGKVKSGSVVVLVGSGVGYNQAGCAFRMP
jgi:3-oxoacyl-[acyl-carrier-protein] synthase-3